MVCKMTYIRDVLKPLAIATERLCVEKYPSLSLVQPVLTALLKKHLVTTDTDPDITVQLTIWTRNNGSLLFWLQLLIQDTRV